MPQTNRQKIYEVRDSDIHGKGLFAASPIKKNTRIGYIEGRISRYDDPHVLWVHTQWGVHVYGEFRYINHSATPNIAYWDDLTITALRDIEQGEELTHNYNQ